MRKHLFHKVLSLLLMFLFGFQSVGMSIDVHYCKGEMQSFSFFGKAEPCEMATKQVTTHTCCKTRSTNSARQNGIHKKDNKCCSNEMIHVELEEDFDMEQQYSEITKEYDLGTMSSKVLFGDLICFEELILHNSDPPTYLADRQVWLQTFLI